jgi:hypothetical protein
MPPNMPLLGTTATANNRVIEDVQNQLGEIEIQRGPLGRDTLSLQTLRLADQSARLAWLAQHIPGLPGTGIVYVLTTRDAEQVANWLNDRGIESRAYYGIVQHDDFANSNDYRQYLEDLLLNNKIKVLVATNALGMGYDKPDLGFVIHYQAAGSVVAYYQQVGRAGRAIDEAFGVLLTGTEDSRIHDFFRRNAFPDERHVQEIQGVLEEHDGLSVIDLQQHLNMRKGQIEKVLKLLNVESPAPVIKLGTKWSRTPVHFQMDHERIEYLTSQREIEWQEIQDYIDSKTCLMAYLRNALDDPETEECGRCAVCLGRSVVPESVLGKKPPCTDTVLGKMHQVGAITAKKGAKPCKNHHVQNLYMAPCSSSSRKTTTTKPDVQKQRTMLFERIGFNPNFRSIFTTRFDRLPDEYQELIILEMNARMDRKLNRNNSAYLGHLLKTTLSALQQDDPGLLIFTPEYSAPDPGESQSPAVDPAATLKQELQHAHADYRHWQQMQQSATEAQLKLVNVMVDMAKKQDQVIGKSDG